MLALPSLYRNEVRNVESINGGLRDSGSPQKVSINHPRAGREIKE